MQNAAHWLWELGEAGTRLAALGALEGAAGNISLFLPTATPGLSDLLARDFPAESAWPSGCPAPLPPGVLLVTGTGRRLRELAQRPSAALCALVSDGTSTLRLRQHPWHAVRPTSEIDSHLAVHATVLGRTPATSAVVHAQPPRLTWLSHVPAYQDAPRLTRQLLRWQPEMIVAFPEGLALLPFETPGTRAQGRQTAAALRSHRLAVWAGHGVVARAATPLAATDLVEYAETAAGYEVTDLLAGRPAEGLTLEQLRAVARRYGVATDLLDRLPLMLLGRGA